MSGHIVNVRAKDVGLFVPAVCGNNHPLVGDTLVIVLKASGRYGWRCGTCAEDRHSQAKQIKRRTKVVQFPVDETIEGKLDRIAAEKVRFDPEWVRLVWFGWLPMLSSGDFSMVRSALSEMDEEVAA